MMRQRLISKSEVNVGGKILLSTELIEIHKQIKDETQ